MLNGGLYVHSCVLHNRRGRGHWAVPRSPEIDEILRAIAAVQSLYSFALVTHKKYVEPMHSFYISGSLMNIFAFRTKQDDSRFGGNRSGLVGFFCMIANLLSWA